MIPIKKSNKSRDFICWQVLSVKYLAVAVRSFNKPVLYVSWFYKKMFLNFHLWISLKRHCPDVEVLHVKISSYTRGQDQLSTPSQLSVFCYS